MTGDTEEQARHTTAPPNLYRGYRPELANRHVFTGKFTDDWPEEVKLLMGELTIAFTQLERILWLSVKRIRAMRVQDFRELNPPDKVSRMIDQLRRDIAVLSSDFADMIGAYLDRAEAANKHRNDFIHGTWMMRPTGDPAVIRRDVLMEIDRAALGALVAEVRQLRDGLNIVAWPDLSREEIANLPRVRR